MNIKFIWVSEDKRTITLQEDAIQYIVRFDEVICHHRI